MKKKCRHFDVNIEQLDNIVDASRERPLGDEERGAIKTALHAMAERLTPQSRSSEKARKVFGSPAASSEKKEPKPGHGRNGADEFTAAERVAVSHPTLQTGCACPGCAKGKVYPMKHGPAPRIRFVGQAPIHATIYELDRLRCNLCGEVFTAEPPEGVGDEKYDESVCSMVAQLKYGRGVPFNRIEALQQQLGIPLPASTQWELVEEGAELLKPAHEELIRQGAQAAVVHSDDTKVKLLNVERSSDEKRTGLFTTGIIAAPQSGETGPKIALFFSGTQHAGENLRDLLSHRAADLQAAILMSDALAANTSKLSEGADTLLANCLAHGRRKFVEVAEDFPEQCRHIIEELGKVYANDAQARTQGLDPRQRLSLHQELSEPVMKALRIWLTAQLGDKLVEPNSKLGTGIKYLLTHWQKLTLFLRHPGAPIDNNVCERAIKKAVLHRKNALFYRTLNGAQVGDLFMSLIHTCELNDVNAFDYLTALQKHAVEVRQAPTAWMPWNYQAALARPPD